MARLSRTARDVVTAVGDVGELSVDGLTVGLQVEVARTLARRTLGLLGRRGAPRALLLHPCSSVHSLGMLIDLQVAYLDRDLRVIEVADLPRQRVHLPRRRAVAVLEAEPRVLSRLGVRPGAALGLVVGP